MLISDYQYNVLVHVPILFNTNNWSLFLAPHVMRA
jgi:hypothetical protein